MKASQLYKKLNKDFITSDLSDDWARYIRKMGSGLFNWKELSSFNKISQKIKLWK